MWACLLKKEEGGLYALKILICAKLSNNSTRKHSTNQNAFRCYPSRILPPERSEGSLPSVILYLFHHLI